MERRGYKPPTEEELAGEVLPHSENRTKIEKLPLIPEDPKMAQKFAKEARKAKKAERKDGQCSACGRKVRLANFCTQCSATFLKEDEIEQLERFGQSGK